VVVPGIGVGVLPEPPELLELQPSIPPRVIKHRPTNRSRPRQSRLGIAPRKINPANAIKDWLNALSNSVDALAAVVETVNVLERGELPVTCTCVGLSEQVGAAVGVPCPR
jgi:hypothetical protein